MYDAELGSSKVHLYIEIFILQFLYFRVTEELKDNISVVNRKMYIEMKDFTKFRS